MLFQIISGVDFAYNYALLAQGIHKMVLVFKSGIFIESVNDIYFYSMLYTAR
jgi:hypothetical protein